jgi:hypothetical protein
MRKTIIYKNPVLAGVLLTACFLFPLQAQNPDLQRELNLEKEYNPSLRDANKINQVPEIKEPEAPQTKIEFSNYTLDYSIPPYIMKLDAKTYFQDFATSDKRGYLNLGISTLLNFDGDVGFQLANSDKEQLSIFASHRSSNSKASYLQKNPYSSGDERMIINDNLLGIDYMHRFDKAKFFADAQYTLSGFNYYGSPIIGENTLLYKQPDDNQINNLFQAHLGVSSINNADINYKVNAFYTLFNQKYGEITEQNGRTENRLIANADIHANFNSTTGIGIEGSLKTYGYNLPANWDISNADSIVKMYGNYNYALLAFNPYLTLEGDNWDIRLGAGIDMQMGGIKKWVISPDIQFNLRPVDEVWIYLLAGGGIKDNSNHDLYYENRYIHPFYRVYDSKSPLDITVGVDFSVFPNFGINLFTGYKWTNDEHFYVHQDLAIINNQSLMAQKLAPQYANAETFKLGGTLKYSYQDIFDVGVKLVYNHWNIRELSNIVTPVSDELGAWNKPSFTGDLTLGYKLSPIPLRLDAGYHLETGRKGLLVDLDNAVVDLKNIHAMNVQGTYTFNDKLSFFARINNLFVQKYDLWYGYPAQNFNIMGGINVRF